MAIKKVTLVGATGNLGAPLLDALVAAGKFRVTVLQRASSKATPSHADAIRLVRVPDTWSVDELREALQGEDAVIASFPLSNFDHHLRLVDAAAAAGVKRFIPADFGSADSRSPQARELVPLFDRKVQVREKLEKLSAEVEGFTWTSIVCGHYFDWGWDINFHHYDLKTKTADIIDDGSRRSSNSSLERVSEAVVRVLERPDETANKLLFVQSFCVSQRQVLESLEKATGSMWKVRHFDSKKYLEERKAKADEGDKAAVEDLVFTLGVIDGNWEERPEFAMELLGLENEDLDQMISRIVSENK